MKIAYEAEDGQVHVVSPLLKGKTLQQWVAEHGHAIPSGAQKVTLVEETPERSERSMWAIEDGKIIVRKGGAPQEASQKTGNVPEIPPLSPLNQPWMDQRQSWSLKDLMTRASAPEPELEPEPSPLHPEPGEVLAIEFEPHAHSPELPRFEQPEPPTPTPSMLPEGEHQASPLPPSLPEPPAIEEHRAPPTTVITDEERRRQAVDRVAMAAMQIGGEQIRYEVAIQAHNGNVDALQMLQDEAAVYGISSDALARQIIMQRTLQEQRVMRAHAVKARALRTIERMTGYHIDAAADEAVQQIKEEGHAGTS